MNETGILRKMSAAIPEQGGDVQYGLRLGEQDIPLNPYLGQRIRLEFQSRIFCVHCGRKTNKSFNQGYCYPCFKNLAQCDSCIIKPETCHFHLGTCREPEWAQQFCMTDHILYLANSSGLKVGITRANQVPVRWIDQGAVQAVPLLRVSNRRLSGLVESWLARDMADKTNWRAMLKGQIDFLDMNSERNKRTEMVTDFINNELQITDIKEYMILDIPPINISYPVLQYPIKVTSCGFDKTSVIEGELLGIKGQYLILDCGVLNLRKHGGYSINFSH